MSSKRSNRAGAQSRSTRVGSGPATRRATALPATRRAGLSTRQWAIIGSGIALVLVAVVVGWSLASSRAGSSTVSGAGSDETVVQANDGQWTNITPAKLASMLQHKDFTLLNVKTPYIGEIAGTDLYIPYTDVAARAAQLPADKKAKIVVYCRSGNESAMAAQTLVDLGFTNIDNLDGGMAAWTASGGQLVQLAR
jgi:rhodanese-related sulfurtransferase